MEYLEYLEYLEMVPCSAAAKVITLWGTRTTEELPCCHVFTPPEAARRCRRDLQHGDKKSIRTGLSANCRKRVVFFIGKAQTCTNTFADRGTG